MLRLACLRTRVPMATRMSALRLLRPAVRYNSTKEMAHYQKFSDDTLEHILEQYEVLAEDVPEVDIELAQGVLTLSMPNIGTYVINKQPPNQQIWLSSPISGPKRYDLVDGKWTYSRDNSTLGDLLREETKTVTDSVGCEPIHLDEVD